VADHDKKLHQTRRERLQELINSRYDGNQTRFAEKIGRRQSQISDTLRDKKSFGEKLATDIEKAEHLPKGWLSRRENDSGEPTAFYHGVALTRAGALLAAEWEKLDLQDRIDIENEIHARGAKKARESRRKHETRPSGDNS
jgi:hypothetical protein